MEIIWFDPNIGTPIVSVANYGITFSKSAVLTMGRPKYVKLGFDPNTKSIAAMVCGEGDDLKIPFIEKERNGYVRVNSKDFIRSVASKIDYQFDSNAIRFVGDWNEESKMMIINLSKPIDGKSHSESDDEIEENDEVFESD